MERYIEGYYCRDHRDLRIIDKESNRLILDALRKAYPDALDAFEISEKTGLPTKTVYSQLAELYREYYTAEIGNKTQPIPRGRPSLKNNSVRNRNRVMIEEVDEMFDPYDGRGSGEIPLPPGKVQFSGQFLHLWNQMSVREDTEEVAFFLLRFLRIFVRKSIESNDISIGNIAPLADMKCCSQCGVNHEARDFIRAVCLRLIDEVEQSREFLAFLKGNNFITDDAFKHALTKIPVKTNVSREVKSKESSNVIDESINNSKLSIKDIDGIGPTTMKKLHGARISSAKDLALMNIDNLALKINCTREAAMSFILMAQKFMKASENITKIKDILSLNITYTFEGVVTKEPVINIIDGGEAGREIVTRIGDETGEIDVIFLRENSHKFKGIKVGDRMRFENALLGREGEDEDSYEVIFVMEYTHVNKL